MRTWILALAVAFPFLVPAAAQDDGERDSKLRRMREELTQLEHKEKEVALAVEAERARLKDAIAALEARRKEAPDSPELAREAAELEVRTAELESRRAQAAREIAAARAKIEAELAPLRTDRPDRRRPAQGKPVTVQFEATPIRQALAYLAQEGALSYAFLEGRVGDEAVTCSLHEVPAAEAAVVLLESAGYACDQSPSGAIVVHGRNPKRDVEEMEMTLRSLQLQIEILQAEARRRELEKALEEK